MVAFEDELLMVSWPVAAPAVVGSNCRSRLTDWPGVRVRGKVAPDTENPAPVTLTALMVTLADPVAVNLSDCVVGVFKAVLPNEMLVAFADSAAVPAVSCSAKLREEEFAFAVMVAVSEVLTAATVALNEAVLAPAATVTLAGTATALVLLSRITPTPPTAAAEVSETVQFVVPEPENELLAQETALTEGVTSDDVDLLFSLIEIGLETDPCVAVSVTVCEAVTAETFATKLAVVAAAATFTEAGIAIALLLLERLTANPPLGAAEVSVTVQVSCSAPVMDEFAQLSPASVGAIADEPLPSSATVVAGVEELPVIMLSWPVAAAVSFGAK